MDISFSYLDEVLSSVKIELRILFLFARAKLVIELELFMRSVAKVEKKFWQNSNCKKKKKLKIYMDQLYY